MSKDRVALMLLYITPQICTMELMASGKKYNVYITSENQDWWEASTRSTWINEYIKEKRGIVPETTYKREGDNRFEDDWQPPSQVSF